MSQSLVKILIHIVFSTKDRKPLIKPDVETELYRYIHGVIDNKGGKLLVGNGTADHSHLPISVGKNEISALIGTIKRTTSGWMKKRSIHDFYWQRGYGAFSVSQSQVATVSRYIAEQKKHHAAHDFKDEFRILCVRHGISLDERYCWE
ncbi:MAG: IS200/IS605 family transposase [Acidobacteria bacterium]|nr:IS200/IS605 family transposase [Acidobacteriota bacterium]